MEMMMSEDMVCGVALGVVSTYRIRQANMIEDDYEWHMHIADCQDNGSHKYMMDDLNLPITAVNAAAALASFIDAEMLEMGWEQENVKVFECALGTVT